MDYHRFMRRRLRNLGVSMEDAAKVASWYIQQIRSQGEDRAVDYLKRVGDTILWYLYESPQRPHWVATKHRFPKAVYCLRKYSEHVLLRVAKFARAVRFSELKPHQATKVVYGATSEFSGSEEGISRMSKVISLGVSASGLKPTCSQPSDPPLVGRLFGRVQSLSGKTDTQMEPPIVESIDIVVKVPELAGLPYWKETFYPIQPGWLEDRYERYLGPEHHPVGEVHAAQEGGGKLRMYAAPYSVVQCLLYPIHYWVDKFRRTIVSDCTYDQLAGARWAQDKLREGSTVFSVDLSTATCRFPLKVQLDLLSSLGLADSFRKALEWACTGEWVVGDELQPIFPSTLRWSVGQPLGIAPSMSMFSLTHNLLLVGLCTELGIPIDSFRVLGDDVVMVNRDLYHAYTAIMQDCGVPISWHKCHTSDRVAEFAGATVTKDLILRPGQWREPVVNNYLDLAKDLRTPLFGEVSHSWVDAQKVYLFMEGIYDPPADEWGKYVKYASLLSSQLNLDPPDPINHGVYWETGIRKLIRDRMGHEVPFLPYNKDWVSVIYRGLPPLDCVLEWRRLSSFATYTTPDQILIEAFVALTNALERSLLGLEEFHDLVKTVASNVRSLYWLPPASKYKGGGHWHKKIMSILAS